MAGFRPSKIVTPPLGASVVPGGQRGLCQGSCSGSRGCRMPAGCRRVRDRTGGVGCVADVPGGSEVRAPNVWLPSAIVGALNAIEYGELVSLPIDTPVAEELDACHADVVGGVGTDIDGARDLQPSAGEVIADHGDDLSGQRLEGHRHHQRAANATDNVGVTRVEFFRDGVSIGSDTSSPYSIAFNTATIADGSHRSAPAPTTRPGTSATQPTRRSRCRTQRHPAASEQPGLPAAGLP